MRTLVLPFLVAAAGLADSAGAQVCPVEVPETRVLVERLLTAPGHAESRAETGLTGASPGAVRLLVDATDAAVCQQINATVGSSAGASGNWRWSYYTVGGRLIVAVQYADPPTSRRVGFVPVYVYDSALNLLGAYAM